jgi:hypothetical protein
MANHSAALPITINTVIAVFPYPVSSGKMG